MDYLKVLDMICGTQEIRIVKNTNLETIYKGPRTYAPTSDIWDVVGMYTIDNVLILSVVW